MTGRVHLSFTNLLGNNVHEFGQLFMRGFALVSLDEFSPGLIDAVDDAHLVERKTHHPSLLGDALQNLLPNPPDGVRNELETPGRVETPCGLHQTEVALVDQVTEVEPAVPVLLGNAYHEPQVRFHKPVVGLLVSVLYPYCQFRLLFGGDPREVPDVTQVTVNGHCPGSHGLHYL